MEECFFPIETVTIATYYALGGLVPFPFVKGAAFMPFGYTKKNSLTKVAGGNSESAVASWLRKKLRPLFHMRQTCRQLYAAHDMLPGPVQVFDWLFENHKVLFPLKSYFLDGFYTTQFADSKRPVVNLDSPPKIKALALQVKLKRDGDSVYHLTDSVNGGNWFKPTEEFQRSFARTLRCDLTTIKEHMPELITFRGRTLFVRRQCEAARNAGLTLLPLVATYKGTLMLADEAIDKMIVEQALTREPTCISPSSLRIMHRPRGHRFPQTHEQLQRLVHKRGKVVRAKQRLVKRLKTLVRKSQKKKT